MAETTAARPKPPHLIPGIDKGRIIGINPKEIPIPTGIKWATNAYDAHGDIDRSDFGITGIGIGKNFFQLLEKGGKDPVLVASQLPENIPDALTRLLVGYLGRTASMRVYAEPSTPFGLSDPTRLNAAVDLASDFGTELAGVDARERVEHSARTFSDEVKEAGREVDASILKLISIMEKSLKRGHSDAPNKFRQLAIRMRTLHLSGINVQSENSDLVSGPLIESRGGEIEVGSTQYSPDVVDDVAKDLEHKIAKDVDKAQRSFDPRDHSRT